MAKSRTITITREHLLLLPITIFLAAVGGYLIATAQYVNWDVSRFVLANPGTTTYDLPWFFSNWCWAFQWSGYACQAENGFTTLPYFVANDLAIYMQDIGIILVAVMSVASVAIVLL